MSELDVIGAITGTDKSSSVSWSWDYLRHYEELFRPFRHAKINFIEIGVASGSSLAAWLRYFERAHFVGIDIEPDCVRFAENRVTIRIGSQEDPAFLHGVAAEFPPSIVIDDGSHVAHHMIASFETLFPTLLPGGVYIFEDLAFHFDESPRRYNETAVHQGLSGIHIFDYLSKFVRARAACIEAPPKSWGFERYAFQHIDSVITAGGFIAVRKRAPRDMDRAAARFEHELQNPQGDRKEAAHRYAEFLIKHETNLARASEVLRESLAGAPRDEPALSTLLNLLIRFEQFEEASGIAGELVRMNPNQSDYWGWLAIIERRRNRPAAEVIAVQRLVALQPQAASHQIRVSELHEQLGSQDAALEAARRAVELAPDIGPYRERVARLAHK